MAKECPNCSKKISFFRATKSGARKIIICHHCGIKLRSRYFWKILVSVFVIASLAGIFCTLLLVPLIGGAAIFLLIGDAFAFFVLYSLWYYLWTHVDRLEIYQAEDKASSS